MENRGGGGGGGGGAREEFENVAHKNNPVFRNYPNKLFHIYIYIYIIFIHCYSSTSYMLLNLLASNQSNK